MWNPASTGDDKYYGKGINFLGALGTPKGSKLSATDKVVIYNCVEISINIRDLRDVHGCLIPTEISKFIKFGSIKFGLNPNRLHLFFHNSNSDDPKF